MRTKQKKFKFSKGVINPRLLERQDLAILESSSREITNLVSTPYGSVKTRGGSENIYNYGETTDTYKLVSFPYSAEFYYVFVLSDEKIDIFLNDDLISSVPATGLLDTLFDELKSTQSEDFMVFAHEDLRTKIITRDADFNDTLVSVTPSTDFIAFSALVEPYDGLRVSFASTGSLPGGISAGVNYYCVNTSFNQAQFSIWLEKRETTST